MARSISTNRVRLGAQLVVMVRTSKLHATERVDLTVGRQTRAHGVVPGCFAVTRMQTFAQVWW